MYLKRKEDLDVKSLSINGDPVLNNKGDLCVAGDLSLKTLDENTHERILCQDSTDNTIHYRDVSTLGEQSEYFEGYLFVSGLDQDIYYQATKTGNLVHITFKNASGFVVSSTPQLTFVLPAPLRAINMSGEFKATFWATKTGLYTVCTFIQFSGGGSLIRFGSGGGFTTGEQYTQSGFSTSWYVV